MNDYITISKAELKHDLEEFASLILHPNLLDKETAFGIIDHIALADGTEGDVSDLAGRWGKRPLRGSGTPQGEVPRNDNERSNREGEHRSPQQEKEAGIMPEIKDSGERTEFATGALRDMHEGKGRFDLLPWEAIWEVAKHCEAGAKKYGERNCEKGIPIHSLIDSAIRHLAKYMMGWDDEPHLRAAAWNVLYAIYMEQKHPEMQDIPTRPEAQNREGE